MVNFALQHHSDLSQSQYASIRHVSSEAFTVRDGISLQIGAMEWTPPQWHVIGYDGDEAVSHVGLFLRSGTVDGAEVSIGGVGGIATLPRLQGQGLASTGLAMAHDFFKEQAVDFGLLICRETLIPFYRDRGWRLHEGPLLMTQREETIVFTLNSTMVYPVGGLPTANGCIDLNGPGW